ncbi:zinc finger MYM-type protein 1-like [Salvia splendens]|uniref:zinc finger MYM-type protein 1-like n=1 Tax=Salvia splendens TaxID=180675 RepID=UPI001C263C17|nr:zinc finger MYM-type protein 1-like [Salvia splendens]
MEVAYRIRLIVSLNVTRFLFKQGLSFRGHDESSSSSNRGNFLELLLWFSEINDDVSKTLFTNAPANNQMNSPRIQKELANACASEVTLAIVIDIRGKVFTLLVDEARDVSLKEQMRVVLRYVNNEGYVIERFIGIVHVTDTSSLTLKCAIDDLLVKHNLSLSKVRGHGYDGASNIQDATCDMVEKNIRDENLTNADPTYVYVMAEDEVVKVYRGWKWFARSKNLRVGDLCKFELILVEENTLRVSINRYIIVQGMWMTKTKALSSSITFLALVCRILYNST